jgi:flagellar hook protein FlgE
MGTLDAVAIDTTGVIKGTYTNGITRVLAQIVLAQFTNPQGVEKDGDSQYLATAASGTAQLRLAGENLDTQVLSGHLERSNVDIANEFADMIVAQRGFQANSKVITTSDEILQEAIYLKR